MFEGPLLLVTAFRVSWDSSSCLVAALDVWTGWLVASGVQAVSSLPLSCLCRVKLLWLANASQNPKNIFFSGEKSFAGWGHVLENKNLLLLYWKMTLLFRVVKPDAVSSLL